CASAPEGYAVRAYDEAEVARPASLEFTPKTHPGSLTRGGADATPSGSSTRQSHLPRLRLGQLRLLRRRAGLPAGGGIGPDQRETRPPKPQYRLAIGSS